MIDRSEAVNLAQHVLEHGSHYPITPHDAQTLAHGVLAMDAALNVNAAVLKMADTAIRESNVPEGLAAFGPIDGNPANTSLENWFPYSAEELERLRAANVAEAGSERPPATTPAELSARLDEISAEGRGTETEGNVSDTPIADAAAIEASGNCDDDADGQAVVSIRVVRQLEKTNTALTVIGQLAIAEADAAKARIAQLEADLVEMTNDASEAIVAAAEQRDRAVKAEAERDAALKWKEAVLDACTIAFLDWDENDPRKTIADLIAWEQKIALDPQVSKEARELADAAFKKGADAARKYGSTHTNDEILTMIRAAAEQGEGQNR